MMKELAEPIELIDFSDDIDNLAEQKSDESSDAETIEVICSHCCRKINELDSSDWSNDRGIVNVCNPICDSSSNVSFVSTN
jgi:hypothetical protein